MVSKKIVRKGENVRREGNKSPAMSRVCSEILFASITSESKAESCFRVSVKGIEKEKPENGRGRK